MAETILSPKGIPASPPAATREAATFDYEQRLHRIGKPTSPSMWQVWLDVALQYLRLIKHNVSPATDHVLYNILSASACLAEFLLHLQEGTEFEKSHAFAEALNQVLAWARELVA